MKTTSVLLPVALCALLLAGCAHTGPTPAGTAPAYQGTPTVNNPSGIFPGPQQARSMTNRPAPPPPAKPAPPPKPAELPLKAVTLTDFKLLGNLAGDNADFTLTGTAHVEDTRGGTLDVLSGTVALTAIDSHPYEHIRAGQTNFTPSLESSINRPANFNENIRAGLGHFTLAFDRPGTYPVKVQFSAAVKQVDGWNTVDFHVAPSVLQPVVLQGLAAETQFQFPGAARPDRSGNDFLSFLPASGAVNFAWKEVRPETEGRLFYSAEMESQINVLPGLMRQSALLNFKVMQGELNKVTLLLHGEGEINRVQPDNLVLSWSVEPVENSQDRRLVIQLNQPQKDQFSILVQTQTPLGTFPLTVEALQIRPENATRFAGYFRIVNEGAVRLEVANASGASQIAPEQFPESDATRAVFRAAGNQRFVFRFAGADVSLPIQADQILPELSVSERLAYHDSENEVVIDAELELDIREAPLRELVIKVPKGYALPQIDVPGLSDTVLADRPGDSAELRLSFRQPVSGRQLIHLRLEHNQGISQGQWTLPHIEVEKAKSVRGFVGVSADPGLRITPVPGQTPGLTDIATAFFPAKLEGIQAAFRLTDSVSDSAWSATLQVERLPQTVQADALHLFSIGELIAYGSSLINYVVSGAPVASFRVELSAEYSNVEFTGKDIRNWQKTNGVYLVQLHTPVSGPYTLLATYVRPFKAQGETLVFTGARPLDAQSEQGYTLVISAYQFQVNPTVVSSGLLALEPAEVPPEYRLFFDEPILKAYRYGARPFNLQLELKPLAQGDSVSQIVDRASFETRISKEGQALTAVRYFIKNRGNPNFRLTIPAGAKLWSATINGAAAVPVSDGPVNLVPLPQSADPNAVLELDLKLASQSKSNDPENVTVSAPIAYAPVMLTEWRIIPDAGRRLVYLSRTNSLRPAGAAVDVSGFAQLTRMLEGNQTGHAQRLFFEALGLVALALAVWRWTVRADAWKYSVLHLCSLLLGLGAFALAFVCIVQLAGLAGADPRHLPADLRFLAPVQQSGSALQIAVSNISDKTSPAAALEWGWPALAALALWLAGWMSRSPLQKAATSAAGWTLLAWAALRFPNGAPALCWILLAFLVLRVLIPGLRQLSRLPRKPAVASGGSSGGAAPATLALLAAGLYWLSFGSGTVLAADPKPLPTPAIPDSVTQTIRVEEKLALGTAKIRWPALKGQALPLLAEPAVMTHVTFPAHSLKLVPGPAGSKFAQQVVAQENGTFDIEEQYEIRISPDQGGGGFALPVPFGLINRVSLTVVYLDVDVLSPQAVSIKCDHATTNTEAALVMSPAEAVINWRPRSRDPKREKPVFHADMAQLFVPSGGVVEGAHFVTILPAQGELAELTFNVPTNATVTDVVDPQAQNGAATPPAWRFDPDTRKLRVTLNPPLSRNFMLLIRSQVVTGPLPFEQSLGLVTVDNGAGQIVGVAGIATSDEVQLDTVTPSKLSPINLEDFPAYAVAAFRGQIPGLALRRAFRYSDATATLTLKASAVEPDVRIETSDTLSLGEDHTTLADSFTADIRKAGIFSLSFVMPRGFDVDSISGATLSQWTELKTNDDRIITLHLAGKTVGSQKFAITLAGPGVKSAQGWKVPHVVLREAGKQWGTLLIVPEQGMGFPAVIATNYTQLDPQKSGIRIIGVLAFRLEQVPASLALDIEQVDPWIEVTSLQHAAVREGQLKITANLLYQIKNAGLKGFLVYIPTNADQVLFQGAQVQGAQFQGAQVFDSLKVTNAISNSLQQWEVKLDRRVIGQYLLQVTYQTPIPAQAAEVTLAGVEAAEANQQRGFVTVQSDPRLQVTVDQLPAALQLAEWQTISRILEKDLAAVPASLTYRLLDKSFRLPLKLQRHEATPLLPARVNSITLNSVISDDGVMLTQARLEILPGDKRLLAITLPTGGRPLTNDAHFWFAFVNDNGVWPWSEQNKILIPLEQQSHGDKPVTVEVFYECRAGTAGANSLDLELLAPRFDLPLENITWRVSLGDKWKVKSKSDSLQLQRQVVQAPAAALDPRAYLESENTLQLARTEKAHQFYDLGNSSVKKGEPQQARRAFEAAAGLPTHDPAFDEDARVQLHAIKLQQALIGLNERQSAAAGDPGAVGAKLRDLRSRPELNYSVQDAHDIIDHNSLDDNAAFTQLAEKLIQQQDAAVNHPAGIRASIPDQGRVLTFQRAVAVEPWTDLSIALTASIASAASFNTRLLILAATLLAFALFALALRTLRPDTEAEEPADGQ